MPELIITDAGRQAAIDANNNGLTVRMTRIAVGTGQYVPVATQTTLQAQVAVADIARGLAIGSDQVQVSARFTAGAWGAYELGVFLQDGTLFAVGSSDQAGDFPTKEAGTDVVVTCTLLISDVPSGSVSVEATVQTTVAKASTTEEGIVELADDADPETDDQRAVTPQLLKTRVDAIVNRLAGTAPAVLDTITEIAAALQNNPNVISEILAAIALRARLDGATFTGATQGLTRPEGDNTRHFATTAFVQGEKTSPVVLDNGFDLEANTEVDRVFTQAVTDFRWLEVYYRHKDESTELGRSFRLPIADLATYAVGARRLFAANKTDKSLYRVDTAARTTTRIGGLGAEVELPGDMTSHNGSLILLGITHQALYNVNMTTGAATLRCFLQQPERSHKFYAVASHGGTLYGLAWLTNQAQGDTIPYTINPSTGLIVRVGDAANAAPYPRNLESHGGSLYAQGPTTGGATDRFNLIATGTGAFTSVRRSGGSEIDDAAGFASHDGIAYLFGDIFGDANNAPPYYLFSVVFTANAFTATSLGALPDAFDPSGMASHQTLEQNHVMLSPTTSLHLSRHPTNGMAIRFRDAISATTVLEIVGIP